jgi:hypothetical protein
MNMGRTMASEVRMARRLRLRPYVVGTGTSPLQGGSGTETMYGSIGNATLIAGTILFGQSKCEAANNTKVRIAA